jgi:hypothetical protein
LWRQTEKAAQLKEEKRPANLSQKVPRADIIEGELARPRRYAVHFDVWQWDEDAEDYEVTERWVYADRLKSPDQYRAEYVADMKGEKYIIEGIDIQEVAFSYLVHNTGFLTY